MKVHELRVILERVPDDLDVIVCSHGACHVDSVERGTANRRRGGAGGNVWAEIHGSGVDRPTLLLRGGSGILRMDGTPWWEPAPDYLLRGPFRHRDDLARRLDPDVPVCAGGDRV